MEYLLLYSFRLQNFNGFLKFIMSIYRAELNKMYVLNELKWTNNKLQVDMNKIEPPPSSLSSTFAWLCPLKMHYFVVVVVEMLKNKQYLDFVSCCLSRISFRGSWLRLYRLCVHIEICRGSEWSRARQLDKQTSNPCQFQKYTACFLHDRQKEIHRFNCSPSLRST